MIVRGREIIIQEMSTFGVPTLRAFQASPALLQSQLFREAGKEFNKYL